MFAYLDHNVLNSMVRGDPDRIADLLGAAPLTPTFSDENLAEIRLSIGHEQEFLDLLERIDAQYLVPILDNQFHHTGHFVLRPLRASAVYLDHVRRVDSNEPDFGLSDVLQKMYGGMPDQSFQQILATGANELETLVRDLRDKLGDAVEIGPEARAGLEALSKLPAVLREKQVALAAQLDAQGDSIVEGLDNAFRLGPRVLNNVKPPDTLRKIWGLIERVLPAGASDLETFFGLRPHPGAAHPSRALTTLEKVNAIYHQLNFVGYHRDSSMSKHRRFAASLRDMTHAGLASYCEVFLCRDHDLAMKAAAAYEYLSIETQICTGDHSSA